VVNEHKSAAHTDSLDGDTVRRALAEVCNVPVLLVCLFVGNAVNEIDERWQQISRREVLRREKIGTIERALLYITTQTGELWPRRSPSAPK